MNAVAALRRLPAQVLADGVAQLGAAQLREQPHGLLDVGDLPPGQALAEECRGFKVLDQRVHRVAPSTPYLGWQTGAQKSSALAKKLREAYPFENQQPIGPPTGYLPDYLCECHWDGGGAVAVGDDVDVVGHGARPLTWKQHRTQLYCLSSINKDYYALRTWQQISSLQPGLWSGKPRYSNDLVDGARA